MVDRGVEPLIRRARATIVGAGLATAAISIPIRGRITDSLYLVDLREHLRSPLAWTLKLLVGAYYDLLFIAAGTLVFLGLLQIWRNANKLRGAVVVSFCVTSAILVLVELVNLNVVKELSTPFTWQWFYYSDSLMSLEARNAISANLTWRAVLITLAAMSCLLVLTIAFRAATLRVSRRRRAGRGFAAVLVLAAGSFVVFGPRYLQDLKLRHAVVAEPVVAFVASLVDHKPPLLLTMKTTTPPDDFAIGKDRPANTRGDTSAGRAASPIRDVLIFVLESVPAEYVEIYGGAYPVTPVLNRYRSTSLRFDNAYAHSPSTNVSLVSILTGTYPWISSKFITEEHPDFPVTSLGSVLKARGYRTGFFNSADLAFKGAGRFLEMHDIDRIADRNSDGCSDPKPSADEGSVGKAPDRDNPSQSEDECTAATLIHWLDEDPSRPFFGIMWTDMTHHPYFPGEHPIAYGVSSESFNRYLNALRHGDEALGMILSHIEQAGMADSTLIVVLGDHGEAFGRHGQFTHASNIYEENVHIPLVFINRRLFNGKASPVIGGISDIAPTILDLMGLGIPDDWQGRSLLSKTHPPRTYFFPPWADLKLGYREGDRKFIYDATTDQYEMYDLAADPHEVRNLIDRQPEQKTKILSRLAAWAQYQDHLIKRLVSPSVAANPQ
jgi:lipoteichoic acid synthase